MPLIPDAFFEDKDFIEGKKLILRSYQKRLDSINSILPPKKEDFTSYKEVIEKFSSTRGIPLWYPYLGTGFGKGALVELLDGSIKYDMISGIGVYWAHGDLELVNCAIDAACQNTIMQGNLQQNGDSYQLIELFKELSGLDHCILTSSGAMALENSFKLAFQKKFPAKRILAFERCFAGRTLLLASITDKAAFREGLPIVASVDYVPFYDERMPNESLEKSLAAISRYIKRYPNDHACMCFELIQGEGGYYAGTKDFFVPIMELLKQHHIPIIVDEIQSFGRTDRLFAYQHFEMESYVDIATVGKLSQVCATLYKSSFQPKLGLISQTFTASTSAIRAALYILKKLTYDGYLGPNGKNQHISSLIRKHLAILEKKYPEKMSGPFGYGLMIAFTPFKGDRKKVMKFAHKLFEMGVICFIAGDEPARIRFLPPIGGLSREDIPQIFSIVEEALCDPDFG